MAITWRGPPQRAELVYCHLLPNVTASTNVGRLAIYISVFQSLEFLTILVHTCVLVLLTKLINVYVVCLADMYKII